MSREDDVYPEVFARFYDLIYAAIRHETDSRFYLDRIAEAHGPVLEVGVGTGRLFCKALAEGADIYGIDSSPSMVGVLKKKLPPEQHHRVIIADVRRFHMPQTFDLIIAPFRVFGHLLEIRDQLAALDRIYDHLRPGGIFIFDLFVPDPEKISRGLTEHCDFEGEVEPGRKMRRITSARSDPVNQVTHATFRFEWEDEQGLQRYTWNYPLRFYYQWELEHLLARSKLKLQTILGDFEGNPLTENSKEFVLICKK